MPAFESFPVGSILWLFFIPIALSCIFNNWYNYCWNTYQLGMCWVKQRACYFPCFVGQSCNQNFLCLFSSKMWHYWFVFSFETTEPWCVADKLLLCHLLSILHLRLSLNEQRISNSSSLSLDHSQNLFCAFSQGCFNSFLLCHLRFL